MRKYIAVLLFLVTLGGLVGSAPQVKAQFEEGFTDDVENVCQANPNAEFCQERDRERKLYGSDGLLTMIAQLIAVAAGVVAVVMIVLAGFRFITAGGNPDSIGSARNTIIYALIGLAVAASAQILVAFVLSRIG